MGEDVLKKKTLKTFVLDTNVLLHDPSSLSMFPRHEVVIPVTVVEELDTMKRLPNELGKNSRAVIRFLDGLKLVGKGDLHTGVQLENGSTVRIEMEMHAEFADSLSLTINDNKILMAAYMAKEKGRHVVFVSKDLAARIKAEAIGLEAQDYKNLRFSYDTLYQGLEKIEMDKPRLDAFYKDGGMDWTGNGVVANEYFLINSPEHTSAIARYRRQTNRLEPLLKVPDIWGVKPRNVEQRCAVDALLRDEIKLVTLVGPAGTGKTLLALACGMRKVFDDATYNRILISRPIVPLGRDIGYLPGTKEEKLSSWMQPIFDNLEFLCESTGAVGENETLRYVMESKKIEMEAVTYIRGRSLPKMYIIVDEAQNLTHHEVKTIVSRAGEGTKVILTGDPSQIDHPYLDKDSNGLTYAVGCFTDQDLFAHIFLSKTERSELAALAAEMM